MIFRIVGKTVEQLKSRRKALEGHASFVAFPLSRRKVILNKMQL